MPNTTRCGFCGSELREVRVDICGRSFFCGYEDCTCDGAAAASYEAKLSEEAKAADERRREYERAYRAAGIPPKFAAAEHERASELADKVLSGTSLYIHGKPGTGKTHLASAIAKELIRRAIDAGRRFRVVRVTATELFDSISGTYGSGGYDDVVARYRNANLLVIEDLGKEAPTPWKLEKLFAVVDSRYEWLRPMIVTSNFRQSSLIEHLASGTSEESAKSVVSRLCEMGESVSLGDKDRRISR